MMGNPLPFGHMYSGWTSRYFSAKRRNSLIIAAEGE